jgi:hypothetical protein
MPYKINWEPRGVLTQWWGHSTTAEMLKMQEHVHAHPNFDDIRYSIHDFTQCESYCSPDEGDVDYSAAIDAAASVTNWQVKIAIVSTSDDVINIVSQYVETGISNYPVRFFPTLQDAREWAR